MLEANGTGSLKRVFDALRRRLPRTHSFVIFAGSPDRKYAGAMGAKGMEMVEITPDNVARAASFRKPEVVEQLRIYVERGAKGWFAVREDEIVGYAFLVPVRERPRVVRHLVIHPGEAAAILFYARPEYRDLGIGPALLREMSARAATIEGIDSLVAWTVPEKRRWARALSRYGLRPAGMAWILEFWGKPLVRYTRGAQVKR